MQSPRAGSHEDGAAVVEQPVPHDAAQAESQQDNEVQLVEEDEVQLAELDQVVSEVQQRAAQVEVAAQEQEVVEVQIAEQEEVFSPQQGDGGASPTVTVVSDSEPEVIVLRNLDSVFRRMFFVKHCFNYWAQTYFHPGD